MNNELNKYNQKRNFKITNEPFGKPSKPGKRLRFVVQHHIARRDHFDLRLEWNNVLKSWAVPKGPSFNPKDKRLAIMVEDHPMSYRDFEGTIPRGEYGGGTVMIWDEGYWEAVGNIDFEKGIKFVLYGKRLEGYWALVHMNENNWLLIKEKDEYSGSNDFISEFNTSIRTNRTLFEIENNINTIIKKKILDDNIFVIESIKISNPDKVLFDNINLTKKDLVLYYQKASSRMFPFLKNRIISTVRCPDGVNGECFFKKHLERNSKGIGKINIKTENIKDDYYYIKDESGIISEVQMNTIEFHPWGSKINNLEKPDIMIFDLDPDENMNLKDIRKGVMDLKHILDSLSLTSFLKTSGGKGYHVILPIECTDWKKFREFAKNIAILMETKWPDKYVSNVRKIKRKNKIFIDWIRNTKGSTSIAPYSVRARKNGTVSMPISWNELYKVAPNEITIPLAIKRLKRRDPWSDFFKVKQKLNS